MFNKNSLHALNKNEPDAIVYSSVNGNAMRLTREDFSSDDEFQRWKTWLDADFHREEKDDHVYANHTSPLEEPHCSDAAAPSAEDVIVAQEEQRERKNLHAVLTAALDSHLTEPQRRRLWQHFVDGKSLREIASRENANHGNIRKSVLSAQKNLKKFLKKGDTKPLFRGDK